MPSNPSAPPPQQYGDFTQPMNGEGGSLQGLELTASLPFDLFSEALTGFGVVASASFFDSSITIRDPESASSVGNGPISLPGLSDRVYNWTLYYERNGFEARVNQRRRSDFISHRARQNTDKTPRPSPVKYARPFCSSSTREAERTQTCRASAVHNAARDDCECS